MYMDGGNAGTYRQPASVVACVGTCALWGSAVARMVLLLQALLLLVLLLVQVKLVLLLQVRVLLERQVWLWRGQLFEYLWKGVEQGKAV